MIFGRNISLFLVLFFGQIVNSQAGSHQQANIFYDVEGLTADDIKNDMQKKGPNNFWAETRWIVRWRPWFDSRGGQCRIARFIVTLNVIHTYPRWIDKSRARACLIAQWETMMSKLVTHEEKHGDHGRMAARDLQDGLAKLPAEKSCTTLIVNAQNLYTSITSKYHQLDLRYDATTRHGLKEGVVLPGC